MGTLASPGPLTLAVATASSGQAAAPSRVSRSRSSTTDARSVAAPPPAGKVSRTTADQKPTYPSHVAHSRLQRAEASLVHAETRPRPVVHDASNGSSSSPTRRLVAADPLGVVAM